MGVTAKVRLRIRDIDTGLAISLGNVTLSIGEFDADADVEFKDLRSFHQALGNAIAQHDNFRITRLENRLAVLTDTVLNAEGENTCSRVCNYLEVQITALGDRFNELRGRLDAGAQ
jgi:hypothetical protein